MGLPARAPRRPRPPTGFTFGGRIPGVVGALMAATVGASLLVAIVNRRISLLPALTLVPGRVFEGEVWRLITWPFLERDPFALLFAIIALWFFAADLARVWGPRKFLRTYLGLALATGVLTTALGLLDDDVMQRDYVGSFALIEALVIAWCLRYPDREVHIWFVLPLTGQITLWITVFLTIAVAAYYGWETVLPILVADVLLVAYLYRRRFLPKRSSKRPSKRRPHASVRLTVGRGGQLRLIDDDRDDRDPPRAR